MIPAKKKAFTLTELLVVVVVIGVLAAVVLPKFNKVVETRKTTEAEEVMAAVRTEQEKRCALDKQYVQDLSQLSDIIPNTDTKNFTYVATATGIKAHSKGKYGYTLQMPSYQDGRLCCDDADCAKLNKDYPSCSSLRSRADYLSGAECQGEVADDGVKDCTAARPSNTQACPNGCGVQTRTVTCNTSTGVWETGAWSGACECSCSGVAPANSQPCSNGCGTQTRTVDCDTSTGEWVTGAWTGECKCNTCPEPKPATMQTCNECGTQLRTVTCDETTGQWSVGEWGECSMQPEDCCVPGRVYKGPAGGQSDTCDGDSLAKFEEAGLASAVKKVCYDVYRLQYFSILRSLERNLVDAFLMSPSFESGRKPGIGHSDNFFERGESRRHHEDVGIVVLLDKSGDVRVPGQSCAYALMLVQGNGHTVPRSAHGDAFVHLPAFHG